MADGAPEGARDAAACTALPVRDGERVVIAEGPLATLRGMVVATMIDSATLQPRYAVLLDEDQFPDVLQSAVGDTNVVFSAAQLAVATGEKQMRHDKHRLFPTAIPPPAATSCVYSLDGEEQSSSSATVRREPLPCGPPEASAVDVESAPTSPFSRYDARDFPGVSLICGRHKTGTGTGNFEALGILWTLFDPKTADGEDVGSTPLAMAAAQADEHAPPPLNKYVGNARDLKGDIVQDGLERYLDCIERLEDLFVAVDASTQIASVLRGFLLVTRGSSDGVRDFTPTVEHLKGITTNCEPCLTQAVIVSVQGELHGLDPSSVWDVSPEAAVLLLWLSWVLKHCTVAHETPAAASAAADAAASPRSPTPTVDDGEARPLGLAPPSGGDATSKDEYGRDAWVQDDGRLPPHEIVKCIAGRWKTLKERTIVEVKDKKATFCIGTAGVGSDWDVEVRPDGIYLLGSKLKVHASTTQVLRWDDGDVWRKLQPTDRSTSPEPQFGLYALRKEPYAATPSPPRTQSPAAVVAKVPHRPQTAQTRPAPTSASDVPSRPGSAPRPGQVATRCNNVAWTEKSEDYTDPYVRVKLDRLADDRLRKIFDALDTNSNGYIDRDDLDAFLEDFDYIEVQNQSEYVDRILSGMPRATGSNPFQVTFEEFSIVMLRMEAR